MDFLSSISTFYKLFNTTISTLDKVDQWQSDRVRTITAIKESIENSGLKYGDNVTVRGTFSDFVPVSDNIIFDSENKDLTVSLDSLAAKPFAISGYHCAILQEDHVEYAGSPTGLPIFYEMDTPRPISEYLTGSMVTIHGRLVSLPEGWGKFLNSNTNVGIYAERIEDTGEERDRFGLNYWSLIRDREKEIGVGSGRIYLTNDVRQITTRVDENRILLIHSYGNNRRHGKLDESGENIIEFHKSNFMNESLSESQIGFLDSLVGDSTVVASWDMNRSSEKMSDWIQKRLRM